MAEYISKNAVRKMLGNRYGGFLLELDAIPSADVAPVVHGRWIPQSNNTGGEYTICSACRCDFLAAAKTGSESGLMDMRGVSYCPNCGAKMDTTEEQYDCEEVVEKFRRYKLSRLEARIEEAETNAQR